MPDESSTTHVIQPVRPGDLITASFVNGLILALQDLSGRVADLEASLHPASPPGGPGRPSRGNYAFDPALVMSGLDIQFGTSSVQDMASAGHAIEGRGVAPG